MSPYSSDFDLTPDAASKVDIAAGNIDVRLIIWANGGDPESETILTPTEAREIAASLMRQADVVDHRYPDGRSIGEVADAGTPDVARKIPPSTGRPPIDTTADDARP